ncbi:MAG: hypothetical protein SFU98_01545 [Leptospiraceae bacterium]|nr:hypothetical protein [Leptospiraceae bacterium]
MNIYKELEEEKPSFNLMHFSLNILFCFILGFLFSLFGRQIYSEIKEVEYEDSTFLAFKLVISFGLVLGFLLKRTLTKSLQNFFELALILLLISELVLLVFFSSSVLQVDYIFHTSEFQFYTFLDSLVFGYFLSTLKRKRLWSFLSGTATSIIFLSSIGFQKTSSLSFFIPILSIIILELCTRATINPKEIISKSINYNHPITDLYFYTTLSLTISHFLLYYYQAKESPDSIFLSCGSGLLFCNLIYHSQILKSKVRLIFIVARILILVNLLLTINQSNFDVLHIPIFFLDFGLLTLLRPKHFEKRMLMVSFFSGLTIAFICYQLHLKFTRAEYLYSFLLVLANLVWLPLIFALKLGNLHKAITLSISYLGLVYFFSPIPTNFTLVDEIKNLQRPIPFTFFPYSFDSENFVYFNTDLPFENSSKLPKRTNFKNKIMVLGNSKKEKLVLTYIRYLDKNSYPFLVFVPTTDPEISVTDISLIKKEYPLFRVYTTAASLATIESMGLSKKVEGWSDEFLQTKLKSAKSIDEITQTLETIKRYASSEIIFKSEETVKEFYQSYKLYANYFYTSKNYFKSLELTSTALKFRPMDIELSEIAFNSISNITPEEIHLPLMHILSENPTYKSSVLKKIFPIYLVKKEFTQATKILNDLEILSPEEEKETLKIEKVKLLIEEQKFSVAEEIIKSELAKTTRKQVWKKLNSDLNFIRETTARIYYAPSNNNKKEDEEKEQ